MNTTYFKNMIAGNVFRSKTDVAFPTKYYLGLSTTSVNADESGATEVSTNGTGYRRVEITSLSVPDNGVVKNSANISFPKSITDWGTITTYIIYDAPTGGNLLIADNLSKNRIIQSDSILIIEANGISFSIS